MDLFGKMRSDKCGLPELPQSIPPAASTFAEMQFDDNWSEASMVAVCRYLRAGMHLRVPDEFSDILPRKL